jgi:hypothetical protein
MRKFFTVAFLVALSGLAHAQETVGGCITDSECAAAEAAVAKTRKRPVKIDPATGEPRKRDTTTIKACGAQWKVAKVDEAVKAKGWPAFWSACAQEAKTSKTVAP